DDRQRDRSGRLLVQMVQHRVGDPAGRQRQSIALGRRNQLGRGGWRSVENDLEQLTVEVVFDDIDLVVLLDEFVYAGGQGQRAQAQIAALDTGAAQAVAGLGNGWVIAAQADDADFRALVLVDDGLGNQRARGLEFAIQANQVVFPIVRALAVGGVFVVACAA